MDRIPHQFRYLRNGRRSDGQERQLLGIRELVSICGGIPRARLEPGNEKTAV